MVTEDIHAIIDQLKTGRNLVYFASGSQFNRDFLKNLEGYNHVILIDKGFYKSWSVTSIPVANNQFLKVYRLGMDCIEALTLFKKHDIMIHCFVAINEGLYEGGGYYALNGDTFLGYAFSQMADPCIHIGYRGYYAGDAYYHLRTHWLDIPFGNKTILQKGDEEYVDPGMFSTNPRYASGAEVTLLLGKVKRQNVILKNGKRFVVKPASIWDDLQELDAAFVRFENRYQYERLKEACKKIYCKNKLFPIYVYKRKRSFYTSYDFDAILALSNSNRWRHIGLLPNQGNYLKFVEKTASLDSDFPLTITFYHLNEGDFTGLYAF